MTKIAAIVCTKDRPKDLQTVLESLREQTRKPDILLVVDGSDEPVKHVCDRFKDSLPIYYYTVRPPGLTKQRNFGISKVIDEYDWIGFLDDDLVLEKDCFFHLEHAINNNLKVHGIGLRINNQPVLKSSIYKQFFLTDKEPGGKVLCSGVNSAIRPVESDLKVDWIYGGATFWSKAVLSEFKFDEWFSGVGYFEDVDFSYKVSRKYELMISSKARCFHYHHPIRKEKIVAHGQWHFVAFWYFISKWKFNKSAVLWSMLGMFTSNLINGLVRPRTNRVRAAYGNLKGLVVIVKGRVQTHEGFQK